MSWYMCFPTPTMFDYYFFSPKNCENTTIIENWLLAISVLLCTINISFRLNLDSIIKLHIDRALYVYSIIHTIIYVHHACMHDASIRDNVLLFCTLWELECLAPCFSALVPLHLSGYINIGNLSQLKHWWLAYFVDDDRWIRFFASPAWYIIIIYVQSKKSQFYYSTCKMYLETTIN